MAPPPGAGKGRYLAPAARPARRGHIVPPAAAAPAGSAWGPLLLGLLLLLGVLWYAIKHYAPMIDADLTTRSNSALGEAGYGDTANVEIDGRNAMLKGSVASESDSERAEEIVANTIGVRSVDNQLEIGDASASADADAERTQPTLTFLSTENGVRLTGTVSDQDYADQITNSAIATYGEEGVSGSITVDANSTNPGWWPAVQELTPDLKNIDGGSFTVVDGSLRLTGSVADEQIKTDIGTKAEAMVDGQLTVDNRIRVTVTAPEPAPLQPGFATYYNSNNAITLYGSLPADGAAQLAEAFSNADKPVENNINVSDEFESPSWVGDFGGSLAAMQDINKAKVKVAATGDVIISGIALSDDARQSAAENIASIFTDQQIDNRIVVRAPEPAPEPKPEPEPVAPTMKPFATVSDDGTTVTVVGLLAPATADAITSAFEGAGRTVVSNVTADERVMEPDWTEALPQTLQSMSGIQNPVVTIASSGTLTIGGEADSEGDRQRASDNSFDVFGNSVSLRNDITVKGPDITELFASIDLAAIRFRSNSSELDADSIAILEQVADALLQVPSSTVAISGHTDSTGNNDRNLFLSGERAERVRNFLIDRGITADRMTSQGFGSSQPIASNDTVTGRALNRRIEFALTNGE